MTADTYAYVALAMDRGEPLGNSEDVFLRRALHVKVGNKATEPVPIYNVSPGTPFYSSAQTNTTPGTEQTLLTFTTPVTPARNILKVVVACRTEGRFTISDGLSTIGSGRTGAAAPNVSFEWPANGRALAPGLAFTIKFTARAGAPISEIETYVMAMDS